MQQDSLHRYAYGFSNLVNTTDPSGLMPPLGATYNGRNANPAIANTNSYAAQPGTQISPQAQYAAQVRRPGFNSSYLGRPDGGIPRVRVARSVNEAAWQPFSDPTARQQSQGHTPKACGFSDVLLGLGHTIVNGNLVEEAFEATMHGPELALLVMPMEYWHLGFQVAVGFSPYDWVLDIGSLVMDRDLLTGEELTDFDKAALLLGVFTGVGDEVLKIGKQVVKAQKAGEAVSALKRGRGLFGEGLARLSKGLDEVAALIKNKGVREGLLEAGRRGARKLGDLLGGAGKKLAKAGPPPGSKWVEDGVPSSPKKRTLLDRVGGRRTLQDRVENVVNARQARKRIEDRLNTIARGDFGDTTRQAALGKQIEDLMNEAVKRGENVAEGRAAIRGQREALLHCGSFNRKLTKRGLDRLSAISRQQGIRNGLIGATVSGLGFGVFETGRQALFEDELSERDIGLAILAGVMLGGSIGARQAITNESFGEAAFKVGAAVGIDSVLQTGINFYDSEYQTFRPANSVYSAVFFSSLTVGVTAPGANKFIRSETLADATAVGLSSAGHFAFDNYYNEREVTLQAVNANFAGGIIGAGLTSFSTRKVEPFGKVFSEILTPGFGAFVGELSTRALGG